MSTDEISFIHLIYLTHLTVLYQWLSIHQANNPHPPGYYNFYILLLLYEPGYCPRFYESINQSISMSLISLPAPLTSPPTGRDLPYMTRVYLRAKIDQLRATDNEIEHDFQTLNQIYPNELINNYDLVSIGFAESAELLASQIPASLVASAYLDIGCGTGFTTLAFTKKLLEAANASGTTVAVRVVDGLAKMVELASRKIFSTAEDNPAFAGVGWKFGDVLRDASFFSTTIPQFEPPCLGTAQRVFLNVRVDQ